MLDIHRSATAATGALRSCGCRGVGLSSAGERRGDRSGTISRAGDGRVAGGLSAGVSSDAEVGGGRGFGAGDVPARVSGGGFVQAGGGGGAALAAEDPAQRVPDEVEA